MSTSSRFARYSATSFSREEAEKVFEVVSRLIELLKRVENGVWMG